MTTETRKTRSLKWREMDKGNTLLEKLSLQFEAFNRSDGKTARTTEWHFNTLTLFLRYLHEEGHSSLLKDFSVDTVREYILYLQKRPQQPKRNDIKTRKIGLSQSSIQCHVRSLKAFSSWLHREEYTTENVLARLKTPKAPKSIIEPLSETEIAMVMSAIDTNTVWGSRDATIFFCFLDTGLRVSELAGLKTCDVHLEEGYFKVFGKEQKERVVPFGNSLQRLLMKYLYHLRPEPAHAGIDNFFLTLAGYPLSDNALKVLFHRLAARSHVTRLHPHLLRHTFAIRYLMNGGDVFSLQQILGHTTLEMVRHYVNLASSQVLILHHRFSPLDRMNLTQVRSLSSLRKGPNPLKGR